MCWMSPISTPRSTSSARAPRMSGVNRLRAFARSTSETGTGTSSSFNSTDSLLSVSRCLGDEPVEAPVFGVDGQDLDAGEARLEGVGTKGVGAHDGAGGGRSRISHGVGEAGHHAPAVDVALAVAGRDRE